MVSKLDPYRSGVGMRGFLSHIVVTGVSPLSKVLLGLESVYARNNDGGGFLILYLESVGIGNDVC